MQISLILDAETGNFVGNIKNTKMSRLHNTAMT
jgi:hypothetical protein